MTARTTTDRLLLALQWALAVVLFETGLTLVGLPAEELRQRVLLAPAASEQGLVLAGLGLAVAAVALVVPSRTGFLPGLTPLVGAGLAAALGATAAGHDVGLGLADPGLTLALALACAAVAVGRAFLAPVTPLRLGPETRDPWHRPPARLALGRPPTEELARRPEPRPAGLSRPPVLPRLAAAAVVATLRPPSRA